MAAVRVTRLRPDLFAVHWTLDGPPRAQIYSLEVSYYDQWTGQLCVQTRTVAPAYLSDERTFRLPERHPAAVFRFDFHFDAAGRRLRARLRSVAGTTSTPQSVTALLDGAGQPMERAATGVWGPVWWSYAGAPTVVDRPTLELLVDYGRPPDDAAAHQMLETLTASLTAGAPADVHFLVAGERVSAHWNVLVASSGVFADLLRPPASSTCSQDAVPLSAERTVEVVGVRPAVFRHLIEFLYTGRVNHLQRRTTCEALLAAADRFQVEALKTLCCRYLSGQLGAGNALRYLVLAQAHSAPPLAEAAVDYVGRHYGRVAPLPQWRLLRRQHPHLFDLCCRRATSYAKRNLSSFVSHRD